jgi:hypothetical protein
MSRMRIVRLWMPLAVVVVGGVLMIVGLANGNENWAEGGALVLSAGLSVWLLNILFRVGVRGDREREQEDAAREYFDRHGRWPDDETEDEGSRPPRTEPPHRQRADRASHADPHRHRPPPRR